MGFTPSCIPYRKRFFAAWILLAVLPTLPAAQHPSTQTRPLREGWQFRKVASGEPWRKAIVPGSIYADLSFHRIIPDPFSGCSHQELEWVGDSAWEYRLEFQAEAPKTAGSRIFLVFHGLDTLAEIRLNGSPLFRADNMFRRWSHEIGSRLNPGSNTLHVLFHPAAPYCRDQARQLGFPLPGGDWAFIRKAPFQFGWDFAPRLPGVGIWQDVCLETRPETLLKDGAVTCGEVGVSSAELGAFFLVSSSAPRRVILKVADESGRELFRRSQDIPAGEQTVSGTFRVLSPDLWWPAGMGPQTLTPMKLVLETEGAVTQTLDLQVGIRSLQLVEKADETGRSFFFQVNGRPFFARGANMVPPHSFLPWSPESWVRLAGDARRSGFNMIRIWGGGVYPPDEFFCACDRLGILVWQDFIFACSMTPWNQEFMDNVRQEAVQQVTRLRKHASLALWCGNNEIDEGWHNWGWQKELENRPKDAERVWTGYQKLFHHLLPEVVRENDPHRSYRPSSPLYGWGRSESLVQGDAHYWGVWWGREPYSVYRRKIPRFMSEFGFQSYPVPATVKRFSDGLSFPDSRQLACRQKHGSGFEIIREAMTREGFTPKKLEEEIYFSQLIQALAYGTAVNAQRLSMPRCMGSLYWQFNDCWPGLSWSGIDHFGRWKAVQYQVKRSFAPLLVEPELTEGELRVRAVSDVLLPQAVLSVRLLSLAGEELHSWHSSVCLNPGRPDTVLRAELPPMTVGRKDLVAEASLDGEGLEARGHAVCGSWGKLPLCDPGLSHRLFSVRGEPHLEIRVRRPAFFIEISDAEGELDSEDNFFHLTPQKPLRIKIDREKPLKLTVRSLWDYAK